MQNRDRIQSVSVKNFGTIAELQVEGFQNINLIIGENGTGKSFLLKAYKQSPASKSKRRRWGYGGMLMSGGGKAPSDKLRSSMRS